MAARELSELTLLTATALEGPTGPQAIDATAQVAEIIALGASVLELEPGAQAGLTFLCQRIRAEFTVPALATDSREAFHELWAEVAQRAMRIVDALVVLIDEGAASSPSKLMSRRLEQGDKVAVADLASKFIDAGFPTLGERLRRTSVLISDARQRLREAADELDKAYIPLLKGFHRGVLIWVLGIGLCAEIAERLSSLVDEHLRPGLVDDAVEFAAEGARLAGHLAAVTAGLQVDARDSPFFEPLLSNDDGVAFLVHATREIPRVFGPEVTYRLEYFRYPDAPNEYQYHVVIDSPAPPAEASERLDALCENWWDNAAASLDVEVFPVVGVIDNG